MTIRRHLRRRRLMLWAALALWCILGLFFAKSSSWATWAWIVAGVSLLVAQFWIRCTRCQSHIPSVMGVGLSKWAHPINFCPFCGVSLDES
jgi:hypothetical protein